MKISFSENQFVNLMFIPVVCNDVNGIAMFDTGAEITVVKKSFFEKIGIKIKEEKCIMGNNNNGRVEATKGVIPYIKIGEMQENNVDIVIVEDSAFDFDKDDDGNSIPADMLLGRNVIKNYYWRINMPERYFEIMPSGTAPKGDIYNWNGRFIWY